MATTAPLVVGAGPVGLAAALFLAHDGQPARLVERRTDVSRHSKALAVNPRSLDLLRASGVAERLLAVGRPILGACFHRGERVVATVPFAGVHPHTPFMLALSQSASERLLEAALRRLGGHVERGTTLVACRVDPAGVDITLEETAGRRSEARVPWLLAADGASSTVRQELGIGFRGSALREPWSLVDVPLRTGLAADHAHVFLHERGFTFLLPVIEEPEYTPPGAPVWRVVSSAGDPLDQLVQAEAAAAPLWSSRFQVAHRIADRMQQGDVLLAGDAAHVHSPLGARGMNLGVEDAWVAARLAATGQRQRYQELRRATDRALVRRIGLVTRAAASRVFPVAALRCAVFPVLLRLPGARPRLQRLVTGLDHPLPRSMEPPRDRGRQ